MAIPKVMGTEIEYGITVKGDPDFDPISSCVLLVNAYREDHAGEILWDYDQENPLADARGFQVDGEKYTPNQQENIARNKTLVNGARYYVDHAHPEYSSPEVTGPRAAVLWDKAGERIMAAAAERVAATAGLGPVRLYKNNTDSKGASYGCHENYLLRRSTPFADIVSGLTAFLVTRQVYCGAGRVSLGADGSRPGYQLSQRADFIEVEVGLETTLKRPIVNTRDEPHASADKYRRLHVIIGDANLVEPATYLKMGTTALVLAMIEDGEVPPGLTLASPVPSLHAVSHDPALQTRIPLRDGRELTALDVQWCYLEAAKAYVERRPEAAAALSVGDLPPDSVSRVQEAARAETHDVLRRWEDVLTRLGRDPMGCHRDVEWVAKLRLLRGYAERESLDWTHPRLAAIDLQWSDVRPSHGLYYRLAARGALDRLIEEEELAAAAARPPEDTRAYFRGECLARYGASVAAASWDSVIFDVPGRGALQRVPTPEPLRGTRAHVGALLSASPTAADLVEALSAS